jgi:hypothetical protein
MGPTPTPDPIDLDSFSSYRTYFSMTFEENVGGEVVRTVSEMESEFVRDPLAQHVITRRSNGEETVEVILVGERQYLIQADGKCFYAPAHDTEPMDTEAFTPEEVLGEGTGAQRIQPDEVINGILCQHYAFTQSAATEGEFAGAEGEVWIAVGGDFIVKYTLTAKGGDASAEGESSAVWTYEVRDFNAPITIEAPSLCSPVSQGIPSPTD